MSHKKAIIILLKLILEHEAYAKISTILIWLPRSNYRIQIQKNKTKVETTDIESNIFFNYIFCF